MGINITQITDGSTGLVKKTKDSLDKLSTTVTVYADVITEKGVNSEYELFQELVDELEFSKNKIDNLIYRLYQIYATGFEDNVKGDAEYGGLPF